MNRRVTPHVRQFLGQRLRQIRKQRGLSQAKLAHGSGLSGKFIGEVERGEKSISVDSLYRVSVTLRIPLSVLADVGKSRTSVPNGDAERIRALLLDNHRPPRPRRAHEVILAIFSTK